MAAYREVIDDERGPGRPPAPEDERLHPISFCVTAAEEAAIYRAAAHESESVSAYLRGLVRAILRGGVSVDINHRGSGQALG